MAASSNRPRALTPGGEPSPTTAVRDLRSQGGCPLFLFRLNTVPGLAPPSSLYSSSSIFSQLPVWPSPGRPWPPPCSVWEAGVLGRRGFALESADARVCRETGARVSTISWSLTWIWCLRAVKTVAGSRWLLTDFRCFTEHKWPLTRFATSTLRQGGWSSPHHRQTKKGENIPRADWSVWPCETRGPRMRSGREVSTETQAFLRQLAKVKARTDQSHNKRVPGQHGSVGG